MTMPKFRDVLQAYVDAAYAECCIRNHGAGRCRVREDGGEGGLYWVRVHGMCVSPESLVGKLRRICHPGLVGRIELNGSRNYVKIRSA